MGGEDAVQVLEEIYTELQAIRAAVPDVSGLASHSDMLILAAVGLLLVGVVIGACAAVCVGRWVR